MSALFAPAPPAQRRIPYGADPFQFGDLRLPVSAPPHPLVVVIHGGFWRARYDLEHIGFLCQALTDAGYVTWSLEYRRLGNPGGGWPGTFLDVAAGVKYVGRLAERFPLDLERVAVVGHSAGGHLALWVAGAGRVPPDSPIHVAAPFPVRGAVSLAGVADLRRAFDLGLSQNVVCDFLGGSPQQYPDRYAAASPIELLPLGVRQALVHGERDENVPFVLSQGYYDQAVALGDPVRLLPLPDTAHFEPIDPLSDAWPTVREAVAWALAA